MLRDKEWEEIRYSLVEGGYFDFEVWHPRADKWIVESVKVNYEVNDN